MKEKTFTVLNDSQIICAVWDNVTKPVGIIQIIHGIYDNIKTYNRFAKFMNKNGYIVFGTDRPSYEKEYAHPRMFDKAVKLQMNMMNYLYNKYHLPVFLFGYGYGGFITQSILQKSAVPAAGVCLTNTRKYPYIILRIATLFAWVCTKVFGANAPANLLTRMIVGKRKLHTTPACTHGFFLALFRGIETIKPYAPFDTPVLMISGAHNSFATNPQFSRALYKAYQDNGITQVTMIIYPDISDNLLLEMNFGSMSGEILNFLNSANTGN